MTEPALRAPSPPRAPLYDPRHEHDACGVGFIATTRGRTSNRPVRLALAALAGLTHRGAIAADAQTGDGAGIAIPLPRPLVRETLDGIGASAIPTGRAAIGTVFLPPERDARAAAEAIVAAALEAEGVGLLGWRDVPVDPSVLGPAAFATSPTIRQAIVVRPPAVGVAAFERLLLLARRVAEAHAAATPGLEELHIASLSSRTLVYKGLFVGAEIGRFYADLSAPTLAVRYAVFHQRYSTNTHPSWRLAQPFRFLAHNGEINTLRGNRDAMRGRAASLGGVMGSRLAADVRAGIPLLDPAGSDSTSLDEAVELLVAAGWPVEAALIALMPEALPLRDDIPDGLDAWLTSASTRIEPWDGPAALVFGDGRNVGAILDRNGLRPAAVEVRRDGLVVVASEAGILPCDPAEIVSRRRLGPGESIVVDTAAGKVCDDACLKTRTVSRVPLAAVPTLDEAVEARAAASARAATSVHPEASEQAGAPVRPAAAPADAGDADAARRRYLLLGLDAEQLRLSVRTMATTGREPIWSMGDDTPLAILARRSRPVAGYLRQAFAQVTNPPIDPERERAVLSLEAPVGRRPDLLERPRRTHAAGEAHDGGQKPTGSAVRCVLLPSPILGADAFAALLGLADRGSDSWSIVRIDTTWPAREGAGGLGPALDRVVAEALAAEGAGADLIVLSDRAAGADRLPVPDHLAVGFVHSALVAAGRRARTDIVVEAGEVFDVHAVAMLLAAGAGAVHPWLALDLAAAQAGARGQEELTADAARSGLIGALELGLRKVLARMGISTFASYRGAQLFDVIGLDPALARRCFPAAPLSAGDVGLDRLGAEIAERHAAAYVPPAAPALHDPGRSRFRADGELHAFAPAVIRALQTLATTHTAGLGPGTELAPELARAAVDDRITAYRSALHRDRPAVIRDLLVLRPARRPIPLDHVEPAESIVRRFVSSAMSLGSLSPEAHQAIAIGMRMLGGASNTGEGGEDPSWYRPSADGTVRESAIKQVASARFGVTAEYLARAEQLEVKMAQGSKPGEGGQLPAKKATAYIAALRRGQPGMSYISPPPHHDIYSIEDLAQLIADLRAVNPTARIGVKLVATSGVGTIAAGVAKAHADYVLISGHAGGTGASPFSSITSAGSPWELGLAEAHQVLVRQGLRDRVALRTDGGLQTGRDVVVAALLGAEEYGFGTAALVALGCDMARQCHLDTCPTGIATQREDLRAKFSGTPESIVAFFMAIAEDVRRELAVLGLARLEDAVGQTRRLAVRDGSAVDVTALVAAPAWTLPADRRGLAPRDRGRLAAAPPASTLDLRLAAEARARLARGEAAEVWARVTTAERAVGAALSGELERERARARATVPPAVTYRLDGAAGQSLGAFLTEGVRVAVDGVANDYVAKGLAGGTVVVRPSRGSNFAPSDHAIAGNTCLYGATGGRLHLIGRAGMRFAVRNSGADAIAEGTGAHACEYMTGGTVVVLGSTGRNVGAGMTGGRAFLFDEDGRAASRLNTESVVGTRLDVAAGTREDGPMLESALRGLVAAHAAEGSARAGAMVDDWSTARARFILVEPRG